MQAAPALDGPSIDSDITTEGAASTAESSSSISQTFFESVEQLQRGELTDASWKLIIQVALPAAGALALLIVAYFAAKYASRIVSKVLCRRVDQTLGIFGGKFTFYSLMAMSGIAICQTIGFDVTGFAAVLAAAGFAIGLAFQGTLSNFAAGILLLVFRPFQVGDVVNTAGVMGKVNAVDLFTTTFDTPDNRRLIVPNSSITGATIENISFHKERRVEVVVGVDYTASLDTTRDVLTACAESLAGETIQGEGRGYQIILANLGASSVDWKVRLWTKSANFFAVQEMLTEKIKRELDHHNIGIPFPQLELHLNESPNSSNSANEQAANEGTVVRSHQILRSDSAHTMGDTSSSAVRASGLRPRARANRSAT